MRHTVQHQFSERSQVKGQFLLHRFKGMSLLHYPSFTARSQTVFKILGHKPDGGQTVRSSFASLLTLNSILTSFDTFAISCI